MTIVFRWILTVFFLFPTFTLIHAEDVPQSQGRVSDFAGVISQDYRDKISALIGELEVKTSAEIAVVTQKSIAPEDEFTYSQKIFDQWGIGKKGKDNGVLVLVAVEERAWRIHTGYGMEGILPDATCSAIGRDHMVPYLRNNDYSQGIYAGVVEIARAISQDAGVSLSNLGNVALAQPVKVQKDTGIFLPLFAFFFFLIWNFPWPIFIGLPFTVFFGLAMAQTSPLAGFLVAAGYVGSMFLRYLYWSKMPAATRGAFWKVLVFGMLTSGMSGGRSGGSGGGWSSGGGRSSGGGGFGGGSSGGGGSGGRF